MVGSEDVGGVFSGARTAGDGLARGRQCSLMRYIEIRRADLGAWAHLARFHYRGHSAGLVDKVFAAYMTGRPGAAG